MTLDTLPQEFRLLLACCRWPPSEQRNAAIREAAGGAPDWQLFLRMVKRHRVTGLAGNGVAQAGLTPPPEILLELNAEAGSNARNNLVMAEEALQLSRHFDAAGVPLIFLKGTALGQLAYGNIAVKQAWDIDLLVPQASLLQACALLQEQGYVRIQPLPAVSDERFVDWSAFCHEAAFRQKDRGTIVEIHWRATDSAAVLPHIVARPGMRMVKIAPGRYLPTLHDEDLFAYLCDHGAHHVWMRVKWLADLAAWLSGMPQDEIARLYEGAKRAGAGTAAAEGLLLCEQLFQTSLPAAVSRDLRRTIPRMLASFAVREMTRLAQFDGVTPHAGLAGWFRHQLWVRGLRHLPHEVGAKFVNQQDMLDMPLPRSLFFLYPFIRLPSWLCRCAGIGGLAR